MTAAVIFGVKGLTLTQEEKSLFRAIDPWGFIIFARNISTPDQLMKLTSELRETVGREAPILIDQEGGRVERMGPPHWSAWLPALDECRAANSLESRKKIMHLRYQIIGAELRAVGIDVNAAPVGDLFFEQSHAVIANRCYSSDPHEAGEIGLSVAEGLLSAGVLPIIKHIPGHGRATVDSHKGLPLVDTSLEILEKSDFIPFKTLSAQPMAMCAHIVFSALDPENCVTFSAKAQDYIRQTLGFSGLMMTDDLSMHALTGSFEDRVRKALSAGCDMILHCNGDEAEMGAIAATVPSLEGLSLERAEKALSLRNHEECIDIQAAKAEFKALTKG